MDDVVDGSFLLEVFSWYGGTAYEDFGGLIDIVWGSIVIVEAVSNYHAVCLASSNKGGVIHR